jgi:hypothetical protein
MLADETDQSAGRPAERTPKANEEDTQTEKSLNLTTASKRQILSKYTGPAVRTPRQSKSRRSGNALNLPQNRNEIVQKDKPTRGIRPSSKTERQVGRPGKIAMIYQRTGKQRRKANTVSCHSSGRNTKPKLRRLRR